MTNNNGSNPTALVPANVALDIRQLYALNQRAWEDGEQDFPNFGENLFVYSRDLEGQPFAFLSGVEDVHIPERKYPDGTRYAAQDGLRVYVSIFDTAKHVQAFGSPRLAQLTDQYLVNQLRGVLDGQLVNSGLWTIGRNTEFRTQGGQPPRMLKRYQHGVDRPPNPVKVTPAAAYDRDKTEQYEESQTFRDIREAQARGEARANEAIERVQKSRTPDKATQAVLSKADAMRARMNAQANTDDVLPWDEEPEQGLGTAIAQPVKRGRGRPRKQ